MTHDLVIRGGTIVDGTGAPQHAGDVGVDGDRITAVGGNLDGAKVLDAAGAIVTPGWVDVHTHYDGQATWDDALDPSFGNGVTTLVMGNCGVGFAPCPPGEQATLIELMEGVEDIPGTALSEGIQWDWESFPDYLDALERMPRALDIGAHVPHAAVRAYVMKDRLHDLATPTISTPCARSCGRRCGPARSGSRPAAPPGTATCTANRCRARSRPTPRSRRCSR
ncbi:MAG: amidohydrolase family protein [Acidimicrobiia bacterium]